MARIQKTLWDNDDAVTLVVRRKLSQWPEGLERLTKLEQLCLEDNKLTEVSDALTRLPKLHTIRLSNNPLSSFADSVMSGLEALHTLDLSGTQLTCLPDSVATRPNLATVKLAKMRDDFDWHGAFEILQRVPKLHSLSLGGQRWKRPPDGLFSLRSLVVLHLNECGLEELPAEVGQLQMLQTLSLWNNSLTALPNALASLPSLVSLVVSKNPGSRRFKTQLGKGFAARVNLS